MAALLASIMIGLASNLDNIGIGISYGARKVRFNLLTAAIIALVSCSAALIGGVSGSLVALYFPPSTAKIIGSTILTCLGIWVIAQELVLKRRHDYTNEHTGAQHHKQPGPLPGWELVIVGVAQSITDLTVGFGVGASKLNIYTTAASIGFFSFLFLCVPAFIGNKYVADRLGARATIFAGVMLIVVALAEV